MPSDTGNEDALARSGFERGLPDHDHTRALLTAVTNALPALVAYVDSEERYRFVNSTYQEWFGLAPEEVIGKTAREVLGEPAYAALRPHMEAALAGRRVTYETRAPYLRGGTRSVRATYVPQWGPDGRVDGYVALVMDITEEKLRDDRLKFMADASRLLSSSLDHTSTLRAIAHLAVPAVADWCAVDTVEDGTPAQLAVAHVDPAKVALAAEYRRRYPPAADAARGVGNVLRTGVTELHAELSDEILATSARDGEHLAMMRELGLASVIITPIAAHGKVLGALTLVNAESGRRFGAADVALAEDLGARAGLAIENARLFRVAQEADRRKDEFLAMLGHELRNPLAPILTALELMRLRGEVSSVREQQVIARQVAQLTRLVDDLLDVSRITRGKVALRRELVEMSDIIGKAIEMASPLLEQKAHRLVVDLPAVGLRAKADPGRLAQVFANVLMNAAKYTDAGGTISIAGWESDGSLSIEISDTGIGIAPEMLDQVFDLFVQSERSLDRAEGGLGIGLKLARSLVELHGGEISARSAGLGQGSAFTITLAAAPLTATASSTSIPRVTAAVPETAVRRVLVVDDNQDAALLLADALRAVGHQVEVAYDGPEALRVAGTFEPHVAVVDIGLPVMDGWELGRRFRREPRLAGTRLIAVTGYGQEADRQRSREAGFEHHFVKPLTVQAVAEAIDAEG